MSVTFLGHNPVNAVFYGAFIAGAAVATVASSMALSTLYAGYKAYQTYQAQINAPERNDRAGNIVPKPIFTECAKTFGKYIAIPAGITLTALATLAYLTNSVRK